MGIKLRPYHPTYVVVYFGMGRKNDGFNKDGFNDVIRRIRENPDIEVELVEEYDDICRKCDRRKEDEKGSIWGKRHTCPSAQDKDVVNGVNVANKRVLEDLGLEFGSVIKLRDLVRRLAKKIPILDDDMIGGPEFQEAYEKGLLALSHLWEEEQNE